MLKIIGGHTRAGELVEELVDLRRVRREVGRRLRLLARLERAEGALADATFAAADVQLPIGGDHVAFAVIALEDGVAYHTAHRCRNAEHGGRLARHTAGVQVVPRVGYLKGATLTEQTAALRALHSVRGEQMAH